MRDSRFAVSDRQVRRDELCTRSFAGGVLTHQTMSRLEVQVALGEIELRRIGTNPRILESGPPIQGLSDGTVQVHR